MEFVKITDGEYRVESNGGKTYIIKYVPCRDDPEVDLWECSCAGYKYRGDCKHIREFIQKIPELMPDAPGVAP